MRFKNWLRDSNEAKPIRDAMEINDQMPTDFGIKVSCFNALQRIAENTWEATRRDLDL